MKVHFEKLNRLAHAPSRSILGLMSGTSLDGLDMALCQIQGAGFQTRVQLQAFESRPFDEAYRERVRAVFARRNIDQLELALLNVYIAEVHAAMVNDFLEQLGRPEVDVLAGHGQTVFHAPRHFHQIPDAPNATLQLGDGDHLAVRTKLITVCDFRQKHTAFGGEGAPLALYGDRLLFSDEKEDRFLLNIGGIANFTHLPASQNTGTGTPAPIATDTGPGNTLIDAAARRYFDVPFDRDGLLAARGRVLDVLLHALMGDPFFALPLPKTTGPEQFNWQKVEHILNRLPKAFLNPYDIVSTLTEFSACSIAAALQKTVGPGVQATLFLSGGGAYNPELCRRLSALLPGIRQQRMDVLGIPADAKEAVLFAVLANETLAGAALSAIQGLPWMSMGKICLPE